MPKKIDTSNLTYKNKDALKFHTKGLPGKIQISATKPLISQRDLALAYSPGVAAPCIEIAKNPQTAYDYTAKGNFVAVISNGTAVLGLGNLGALASKPVMEGKSVLFKRFADIDSIDVEVDTENIEEFINCVKYLGPSWGGINLEDIKAPDCFIIEQRLKEEMNIPIFHDDQHGTAIISAAGIINAAHLADKKLEDMKMVVLGAGSAGIACIELAKEMGIKHALLLDRTGVIYKGRKESMNQWKEKHAIETTDRTLEDAMKGADIFMGLSSKGAVNKDMVKSMANKPIIFAMANPDPEITPSEVAEVRDDAIVATGRSDYNNQVNNVLGFPYIFRGALDVQATTINEEMKIAAARAIAQLARKPVPEEVVNAYGGKRKAFGAEYIIPSPFDPRLISTIPSAVARAAMETGVAQKPIEDFDAYEEKLASKLNPTANTLNLIYKQLAAKPKTIVFAEGEEENAIRSAFSWRDNGYGKAILIGREDKINDVSNSLGIDDFSGVEIANASKIPEKNDKYIKFLYEKLQRKGFLERDCVRLVKNDRNYYASCMLELGDADLMVTGLTRSYNKSIRTVMNVVDPLKNQRVFGLSMLIGQGGKTIFMSDTAVHCDTTAENLANIAIQSAEFARKMGHTPRVALLSFSNFGNPQHKGQEKIKKALDILKEEKVDFEFDGDLSVEAALNKEIRALYPFSNLTDSANILIMPDLNSAHISAKLCSVIGGGTLIGPVLMGLEKPVQIAPIKSNVSDILNIASIASVANS